MSARRVITALLVLSTMMSGPSFVRVASTQPTAPPGAQPPPPPSAPMRAQQPPPPPGLQPGQVSPLGPGGDPTAGSAEVTPARLSYVDGDVSFWRAGADDWVPAMLNTPLAPGDVLYAAPNGNVEIQVGPRAFVRAAYGTQISLDNQELRYMQFRVTGGQAALDLRGLPAGSSIELDTPNAAYTVERPGYYHLDVEQDSSRFSVYRGGSATMTPAGGAGAPIAPNQEIIVTGTESPQLAVGAAPQLTVWDNWNYQRSAFLVQPANTRYVAPTVYGTDALEQYGTWRTVETYGSVWVPSAVEPGWVPYSTGRWIWDPRFGWTWLDSAPWGWAPYHYGRWVFVGNYWGWAPGPVVVRPAYAPALVVFLGGGAVSVGRPLCWAPLGWGEPVVPWWGRPGFVGVPWWGGWGGPRVVNNVVINRNTTVNVTNITTYRNVHVTNAVVGVPGEQFGRGTAKPVHIPQSEVRQLAFVHGPLTVKPVAASVMPATGATVKPPKAMEGRGVVATRPPHDPTSVLRANGLPTTHALAPAPAPHLVTPPQRGPSSPTVTSATTPAPGASQRSGRGPNATVPRGPDEKMGNAPERQKPAQRVPPPHQSGASPQGTAPSPQRASVPPPPHGAAPPSPRQGATASNAQAGRGQQPPRASHPPRPPSAEHQARREAPPHGEQAGGHKEH